MHSARFLYHKDHIALHLIQIPIEKVDFIYVANGYQCAQ